MLGTPLQKTSLILFLCIFVLGASFAQSIDTTLKEYFPFRKGNLWQYLDQSGYISTLQVMNEDSIMPNGYHYAIIGKPKYYPHGGIFAYRLDSLYRLQQYYPRGGDSCGSAPDEWNTYRLNEPPGSYWHVCFDLFQFLGGPEYLRYDFEAPAIIFGKPTTVRVFSPGGVSYPGSPHAYWVWESQAFQVGKGFGVLHEEGMEMSSMTLTGAIIDDVQYGRIVGIHDAPAPIAQEF